MNRHRSSGFVLVFTIFMLAAITIAASYFAVRVQKSLEVAQRRQSLNDQLIKLNNTRSEILFRLATNHFTANALGQGETAIVLDNRPYRTSGNDLIQLQDERGLLNLNLAGDEQLERLLGVMNVPADRRPHLIDALRDYTDEDNLRRLNGAEAQEYQALGLRPPRNAPLVSPMELKNIIGWRDSSTLWGKTPITEYVTVSAYPAINPNTAPWQVLATLPGVNQEFAEQILSRRKLEPNVNDALIGQMTGVSLTQIPPFVLSFPASSIRITQQAEGMPWGIRYNIRLTPQGKSAPWEINYYYRLEAATLISTSDVRNKAEISKLPPRTTSTESTEAARPPSF